MLVPVAEPLGVTLKVAEIPPGPPVMSTLVAEIYGPTMDGRLEVADKVREIFATTDGVVDVDWEVEAAGPRLEILVDREKAIRAGITVEQVVRTVRVALDGADAGLIHDPDEPRSGADPAAPRSSPTLPHRRSAPALGARRRRPDGAAVRDGRRWSTATANAAATTRTSSP